MTIKLSDHNLIPHEHRRVKVGQTLGKLTIVDMGINREKDRQAFAIVQCNCGSPPKIVQVTNLRNTKSCGCNRRNRMVIHGKSKHPLYYIWKRMISRCTNPKTPEWKNYGGRGIIVCDKWKDVCNFIEDMEPTYKKGLTLERINNDQGYNPENCTWATYSEQHNNKRTNHFITYQGRTQTIAEWSRETGLGFNTIRCRIVKQKLSPKEALTRRPLTLQESIRNASRYRKNLKV